MRWASPVTMTRNRNASFWESIVGETIDFKEIVVDGVNWTDYSIENIRERGIKSSGSIRHKNSDFMYSFAKENKNGNTVLHSR